MLILRKYLKKIRKDLIKKIIYKKDKKIYIIERERYENEEESKKKEKEKEE